MTQAVQRFVGTAIAVPDLDDAIASYERLGFALSDRSSRPEWGAEVATFGFDDGGYLELISGVDVSKTNGAAIAAFAEKFGAWTYLSCFDTEDIGAAHELLEKAGIDMLGPPSSAPESVGEEADMLWLRPSAMGGAFTQLLQLHAGPRQYSRTTAGLRLFTQVLVAEDPAPVIEAMAALGAVANPSYDVAEWGVQATVFQLPGETNLEVTVPIDTAKPQGAALRRALDGGRGGHYMTTFEVDDVDRLAESLVAAGVRTLGPPTDAPASGPWGPCRQLWVHPSDSPGTFIQFLTRLDR